MPLDTPAQKTRAAVGTAALQTVEMVANGDSPGTPAARDLHAELAAVVVGVVVIDSQEQLAGRRHRQAGLVPNRKHLAVLPNLSDESTGIGIRERRIRRH